MTWVQENVNARHERGNRDLNATYDLQPDVT